MTTHTHSALRGLFVGLTLPAYAALLQCSAGAPPIQSLAVDASPQGNVDATSQEAGGVQDAGLLTDGDAGSIAAACPSVAKGTTSPCTTCTVQSFYAYAPPRYPVSPVIAENRLFFLSRQTPGGGGEGTLDSIDLTGTPLLRTHAPVGTNNCNVVVEAGRLTWVDRQSSDTFSGQLYSVPIACSGAACTPTRTPIDEFDRTRRLFNAGPGRLWSLTDSFIHLIVDGKKVAKVQVDSPRAAVRPDGTLYAVGLNREGVLVYEPSTFPSARTIPLPGRSLHIAVDCSDIYVVRDESPTLDDSLKDYGFYRLPLAAQTALESVRLGGIQDTREVYNIAADSTHLYLAQPRSGVLRVSKSSGDAKLVATGSPWSVATDDMNVYFDDHDETSHSGWSVFSK